MKISIQILLLFLITMACNEASNEKTDLPEKKEDAINLQHFYHLYQEISIDGDSMAIVHIYSEAPDYVYAIEPKEGYTCVDDVARATVMLTEYYKAMDENPRILHQIKLMLQFILHMQNENGYFNNFIWNDLTINTTYRTTVAELNWWSLRALWALETALVLLDENDPLSDDIKAASARLVTNLKADLGKKEKQEETINGVICPTWLPNDYAADQAAVLILGLLPYQKRTADQEAKQLIDSMAKGIMLMQKGGAGQYPYGVFLSWQNLWHAWGNSQAYALLRAGRQFNDQEYIRSALKEVDHFYPHLLKNGFVSNFRIEGTDDGFTAIERNEFDQIAYGIRPMVWAAVEAYQITENKKYAELADELKSWFFGNNVANAKMYDAKTGRGYDGIISKDAINKNAGAESTLESLMSMIKTQ